MKFTLGTRVLPPGRGIEYFNYRYRLGNPFQLRSPVLWQKTPRSWSVVIGHGSLMLLFLISWSAFLAWRSQALPIPY